MSDVYFCEQWFRGSNYPADFLSEEQARELHEEGKPYTALLGDVHRPYYFLEFSAYRSVCVEFLDRSLRSFRDYSFQEKRPSEFFLSQATLRRFVEGATDPSAGD